MEECPNCFRDNAYFDGVEYVCPDCGYTWDCPECPHEKEDDDTCDRCPECGSKYFDTFPNGDYLECYCTECGCHWTKEDCDEDYDWDDEDECDEDEEYL